MTDLCDRPAIDLRAAIGRREISPVELVKSCLARIDQVNGAVNAMVTIDEDGALAAARNAEAKVMSAAKGGGSDLGLLHGLPIGIKDLNETAGLRTTFGSLLHEDHVPLADDASVTSLRRAGGIILGKTNTPEFGAGANTINSVFGFTGNPFNPERSCGGSSGGAAVVLATSMVPLANGSDLGGSLRTPAAYCGVLGFRSTPGLFPDLDRNMAWSPLAVDGPMARTVPDLCLMAAAMARYDRADPLSFRSEADALLAPPPCDLKKLRVAFSEDLGFALVEPDIRRVFRDRCGALAPLFGAAKTTDPTMGDADHVFEVLRAVGFLAGYRQGLAESPDKFGPNVTANVTLGERLSAADVADAEVARTALFKNFLAFMENYDLLICPVAPVSPIHKDQLYPKALDGQTMRSYIQWVALSYGITLTGHPSVAMPCGLDECGMPFGIQVVGRRGEDARLLGIAKALEEALTDLADCQRPIPDLTALEGRSPPQSKALES
ncbi:MAG: amidase family protein [Pseudomonadota bacterium]